MDPQKLGVLARKIPKMVKCQQDPRSYFVAWEHNVFGTLDAAVWRVVRPVSVEYEVNSESTKECTFHPIVQPPPRGCKLETLPASQLPR